MSDQARVLQAEDLEEVYGHGGLAVRAVDGVSLELLAGELVLIAGPSGSGKTTLEQYRAHHLSSDLAFSAATEHEILEQTKQVVGDVAWVMTRSRRTGTYRDREVDSLGVETVVLHKVEAGWRIAQSTGRRAAGSRTHPPGGPVTGTRNRTMGTEELRWAR